MTIINRDHAFYFPLLMSFYIAGCAPMQPSGSSLATDNVTYPCPVSSDFTDQNCPQVGSTTDPWHSCTITKNSLKFTGGYATDNPGDAHQILATSSTQTSIFYCMYSNAVIMSAQINGKCSFDGISYCGSLQQSCSGTNCEIICELGSTCP